MKNKKQFIRMLVLLALTALAVGSGFAAGTWGSMGEIVNVQWNLNNIIGVAALICGTLFLEKLVLWLLGMVGHTSNRSGTLIAVAASLVRYIAAIVILCGVLALLGVDIVTIVAGLGVIALIIGFGAESLIADVVTGVFILMDNQYNVGDIIEVDGFRGTVSEIGIRTTCVTDTGGNIKIINNSDMKNILNRSDNSSKAVTDFGIPYATDLEALEKQLPEMLKAIYEANKEVFTSVPVYAGVQELGDSAVLLRFVGEVGEQQIYTGTRVLNRELLIRMRKIGVECPFPQLDVHRD